MASRIRPRKIAAKGRRIYLKKIKPKMGSAEKGKFVVIDVDTENYEISTSDAVATRRLLTQNPNAITWAERVGYRAAYGHGGGPHSLDD